MNGSPTDYRPGRSSAGSRGNKSERSSSSTDSHSHPSNGKSTSNVPQENSQYCPESPTLGAGEPGNPTDDNLPLSTSPAMAHAPNYFPQPNIIRPPTSSIGRQPSTANRERGQSRPNGRQSLSSSSPSGNLPYQGGLGPASPNSRHMENGTTHNPHQTNKSHNASRKGQKSSPPSEPLPSSDPDVPVAPTPGMYWSKSITQGSKVPKSLRAHSVNLVGESMFVFGGGDAKTCSNDLYILDLDTMYWSKPKTPGDKPPPCRAHSATMVDNKRIYVFGGGDGPNYFEGLYVLDIETLAWSKPKVAGTPPSARRAHATCVYQNKIYIFGGGDGFRALNDLYSLDVSDPNNLKWSEVETHGRAPRNRGYHSGNLVGDKLIVYGGSDGHECFSDVHVLDLSTNIWHSIDLDRSVISRLSHTATQVGSYLFIIGGHDGNHYSSDVLLLNLVTMNWETRRVYGAPPSGRGYHTTVLYDSRLFMFGGYDGKTIFDDVYVLDLSACAYLPQITNFKIEISDN